MSPLIALLAVTLEATPPLPASESCICDPATDSACTWPALQIVSRDSNGQQAPRQHAADASLSADGRWVAFRSRSRFFARTSTHPREQIYLKDLHTGELTLASPSFRGGPSENQSYNPVLSHDGRRVAFVSFATDLVPVTDGLRSMSRNVFVFDRLSGQVELISASPDSDPGNHSADLELGFSPNGDRLVFASRADNLHPDDTDHFTNVFLHDFTTGVLSLVEPAAITNLPDGIELTQAREPSFSGASNQVTYIQQLSSGLPGGAPTVVHDLDTDLAEIISVTPDGVFAHSATDNPVFSDDGNSVLFLSQSTNLVDDEVDRDFNAYVKDLVTGEIILASRNADGDPINDRVFTASISSTGRYVAFTTEGRNAVSAPRSNGRQVFLFDRQTGRSRLLSQAFDGGRVTNQAELLAEAFTRDGRLVFEGRDRNYVVDDLNGNRADIYLTGCGAP